VLELAMFGWTTPVLAGGIIPAFWEEANGNGRTGWKWMEEGESVDPNEWRRWQKKQMGNCLVRWGRGEERPQKLLKVDGGRKCVEGMKKGACGQKRRRWPRLGRQKDGGKEEEAG